MKKNYAISGMTCAACAQAIDHAIKSVPGIDEISVNFATEEARVVGDFDQEAVFKAVKKAGYRLISKDEGVKQHLLEEARLKHMTIVGMLGAFVLFLLAMVFASSFNIVTNHKIQFVIASALILLIGRQFISAVPRFFRFGIGNMNTLIGFGILAAWFYSTTVTFFSEFVKTMGLDYVVYFEAVGFIMAFVHLGKWLELKAKHRAKEGLSELLEIAVKHVVVWRNEAWIECELDDIKIDEVVRIPNAAKIPIDGVIVKGISAVDESMLTGESVAVAKSVGDKVFAGTLNTDGHLEIKVTGTGDQTTLANMVMAAQEAQSTKAPIQQMADRISAIFVPVVLAIAIMTVLSWGLFFGQWSQGISSAIAVLVIACPCALGLATPLAMVVSSTLALKQGILIAGADVIEKATKVDSILFDKTGTLTRGQPELVNIHWFDEKWKAYIVALQEYSEHPLAKALVKKLGHDDSVVKASEQIEEFDVLSGIGIRGRFGDDEVYVVSARYLKSEGIETNYEQDDGFTRSYGLVNKKLVAVFDFKDAIKEEAFQVLKELKSEHKQLMMVTGDRRSSADMIAKELELDQVIAETMPQDKDRVVQELQEQGHKILMVGDGVNDLLALSRADLSMAMGSGSDVAIVASDITLVRGRLEMIPKFFKLAHETFKIAKQNLFLSFIYNLLCLPLAATGNFPPMFAAMAMGLSSLSVVANSLRLKRIKL